MTRLEALKELAEKVEAGGELYGFGAVGAGNLRAAAECAYAGSLDAALALHEAVLPGWAAVIRSNGVADVLHPEGHRLDQRLVASDTPARAWLLAVLRALIAQEEAQ